MFEKKEYIYAVYKEKSFTAAAEKLFVSQPCLSAAVKKTEQRIGYPLFERRSGEVVPTRLGYEYLAVVERMMALEASFAAQLEDIHNLRAGSIRIGGSNYVCSDVLPGIVNAFSEEYPNIEVSIFEASSVELDKMLLGGKIDLVIDSYDARDDRLDYTELSSERILLAVPSSCGANRAVDRFAVTAEDLYDGRITTDAMTEIGLDAFSGEKFILLKNGHSMYKHATAAFEACGFSPSVSYRLDQLSTSYRLAASGNGLCFVPDTMFKTHRYRDDILLYNVRGAGMRTLYAVQKKSEFSSSVIRCFTAAAQHVISASERYPQD